MTSLQRAPWGHASQVAPDLWRLRLTNTRGTLLVNTYVYKTPHMLAIIDPGWPWSVEHLRDALRDLNLANDLSAPDMWLYTHTHIDHMGAAAILEHMSAAPHVTWAPIAPELPAWHAFQDRMNDWSWWVEQAFCEPERSELLTRARRPGRPTMTSVYGDGPVTRAQLVELGDTITLDDLTLTVLDARGHDPYHIALYSPERQWLFAGDALIATPSPILPAMHDDLDLYVQTLDRLDQIPTALLLPGHGSPTTGLAECAAAVSRSRSHVLDYRARILAALAPLTAPIDLYSLALLLTPDNKPLEGLQRWWVHLGLIDAHLAWLAQNKQVLHDEGRWTLAVQGT
jgi:glyoxylase-like metal-dependent hydrolase (beta-lactamase superfamily II)